MFIFQSGTYQRLLESKGEFSIYLNEHVQNNRTDALSEFLEPSDTSENQQKLHPLHSNLIEKGIEKLKNQNSRQQLKSEISSKQEKGQLVKAESVEKSSVKRSIYLHYIKSMGFRIMATAFFSLTLSQVNRQT